MNNSNQFQKFLANREAALAVLFVALIATWYIALKGNDVWAQAAQKSFSLLGGETATINCAGQRLGFSRLSVKSLSVRCIGTTVTPPPPPPPATTEPPTDPTSPPPVTTIPAGTSRWHAVGSHDATNIHEHGDQPPAWADEFSLKNFGHPVVFGGDEATPNENVLKHQAYKGFLMKASGVDVYIRYHAASNPHDRAVPFHSYEVYSKDASNNVSFWQGHIYFGYPEQRSQRMARHNEQGGFDPLNGITWPGRGQFIIAGSDKQDWDNYLRCEQWYGHAGLWSWDMSITICGATTFYQVDEHLGDFHNMATWKPTGSLGGSRRLEVSHYGPSNPLVTGETLPFNKWFCVKKAPNENRASGETPTWSISGTVDGPKSCQDGWLPQYIADTFPKAGVYFQTGNTAEKNFPTTGVTLPN